MQKAERRSESRIHNFLMTVDKISRFGSSGIDVVSETEAVQVQTNIVRQISRLSEELKTNQALGLINKQENDFFDIRLASHIATRIIALNDFIDNNGKKYQVDSELQSILQPLKQPMRSSDALNFRGSAVERELDFAALHTDRLIFNDFQEQYEDPFIIANLLSVVPIAPGAPAASSDGSILRHREALVQIYKYNPIISGDRRRLVFWRG